MDNKIHYAFPFKGTSCFGIFIVIRVKLNPTVEFNQSITLFILLLFCLVI